MASDRQHDRHTAQRAQTYDRDGTMYDDASYEPQSERTTTWPRSSHSHGRSRTPPEGHQRWDRTSGAAQRGGQGIQIRGRAQQHEYRDRDQEGYRSPQHSARSPSSGRRRSRSRSYSPNRRSRSPRAARPGQPSKEVMLDGLPPSLREEDISYGLKTHYNVGQLEDVRIIKDRWTGEPRGFGFVRFPSIHESRDFVESNFPTIRIASKNATEDDRQASQVRIAYSREREDRGPAGKAESDWHCMQCSSVNFANRQLCFKCGAPPVDMAAYASQARQQEFLNSGDSDAAMQGPASQFLLIRGLEPNVTEDLLAKGAAKLLKPTQAIQTPAQTGKKSKISSTTDNANLGAREGSIRRVFLVRDRQTNESWRYGFAELATIEDAQAALLRYSSLDRFTISSKPVSVSYIHTGVFVPVFEATQSHFCFTPIGNNATQLRYWNEHAFASELTVADPGYDDAAVEAKRARLAADTAAAAAHKEGLVAISDDADVKAKKRKADAKEKEAAKSKKTTPAHLQFWSNRHAELHGVKPQDGADDVGDNTSKPTQKDLQNTSEPSQQSYTDPVKMCCYLCSRQFKSIVEVNKHERLSQLHRDNVKNEGLREKALAKLAKAGLPIVGEGTADEDTSEYRDRARERRQAFGPSKKISLPMKKNDSSPDTKAEIDKDSETPVPSKGAALLGKMGWTSGEGLGARGEGTKEAIATNIYAAGVGLGAEGGKLGDAVAEAAQNSRGDYKEFLQKTKDKAKARFESMS